MTAITAAAPALLDKSTNVRALTEAPPAAPLPLAARAVGAGVRALGAASPSYAGRVAARLFLTPPRPAAPARERPLFESARRLEIGARSGERLAAWSWTEGDPAALVVLLVHGWGGRASQLGALVPPLVRAGFEVLAFDHVGHGGSEGRLASIIGFARTIEDVVARFGDRSADGVRGVHAIVGHSLGASATVLALAAGLRTRRAVLIAPASRPFEFTSRFAGWFHWNRDVLEALRADVARRLGISWAEVDVLARAGRIAAPLRIYHDRVDAEVAWEEARDLAAAAPDAALVSTSGLGHRRILRDADVVGDVVRFVTSAPRLSPQASSR
jgi:pimeloyl-ACP methyl ester carboxylesterase